MIHPCETSLGEEVRTLFKTEGSTREAGDPQSKMKSTRISLGLYFCSAFIVPIMAQYVIDPVKLAIDVTVRIFNYRVLKGEITA